MKKFSFQFLFNKTKIFEQDLVGTFFESLFFVVLSAYIVGSQGVGQLRGLVKAGPTKKIISQFCRIIKDCD